MSNLPDFTNYGYKLIQVFGRNYIGGRVTYMATNTITQQTVVVKHFQFALIQSEWSGLRAYEREIQVLQELNHPGIPRYLDSFETTDGFCMVQEYKSAQSLAVPRLFEPDEIKQIAISLLEILVYLQSRFPAIIHRDLKPENILVDEELNVYLVDFGFARIGSGEVALSSVTLGTLGFMPPEQLYNRQLNEATDLYSLGMTIICLLTQTKSTAVDTLINEDGRIDFKPLVSQLSDRLITWLETLVQSNPKNRYANAATALKALQPIPVLRLPEVQLSTNTLEYTATKVGETLTKVITISSSVPGTILEGYWEVAPHPYDPPHTPDSHTWISCYPAKFSGERIECEISIDTSKLMPDKLYNRHVFLHTNHHPEISTLTINVNSAQLIKNKNLPYWRFSLLYGLSFFVSVSIPHIIEFVSNDVISLFLLTSGGSVVGGVIGAVTANSKTLDWSRIRMGLLLGALVGFGQSTGSNSLYELAQKLQINNYWLSAWLLRAGFLFGAVSPILMASVAKNITNKMLSEGHSKLTVAAVLALTTGLGIGSGFNLIQAPNLVVILALLGTGLPLSAIMLYPPFQRARLGLKYRKLQQNLIKE